MHRVGNEVIGLDVVVSTRVCAVMCQCGLLLALLLGGLGARLPQQGSTLKGFLPLESRGKGRGRLLFTSI